jgi:serine/threonine protein kinase
VTLQTERELFEACMDLAPGHRTAWLDQHCGDAALRERILRLLRAHDAAEQRGSLEQSPLAMPRRIGGFDLLERIGEGAMGEVWLAEQTAPVRRRVAVKIVKAGTGSREVIARFELERQALAMMSHPHIAHIVEAGTTDDGRPYFAMEYVPGIPLTKYCDQHRLGIDERLALFIQVCEAVQHAHHKGVIHRDLKPGNLLVTEIDGRPSPKVIDFAIAKAVALDRQGSRARAFVLPHPNRSRARAIAVSLRDNSPRGSRAISTGSCSRRWRRIATVVTARLRSSQPISAVTLLTSRSSPVRRRRYIACESSRRAIACRSRSRPGCSSRRWCSAR